MSEFIILTQPQHAFIDLIYQIVITNPFGDEIIQLEHRLSGNNKDISGTELSRLYIEKIDSFFKDIDKKLSRPALLADFEPSARHKIFYTICFRAYHIFQEKIDNLTALQVNDHDKHIPVTFADSLINLLAARGIDNDAISRVIGFLFQLRRAWHFISNRLAGTGPSLRQLRQDLWNNIFTHSVDIYEKTLWYRMEDFSTLILGPTGSGKGAVAAAIGYSSYIPYDIAKKRFTESFPQNFISVNLSQYPETLLESELFGHARGAFTGAVEQYDGLFARCGQYGTVFLDEIGELQQHTQVKLLKVLEERAYNRLGSHEKLRFQGRVLAATHRPIDSLSQQHGFREDLYYRLCSDVIYVPSLRQRLDENPDELLILVGHLLGNFLGRPDESLAEKIARQISLDIPIDHPWPGNVRELAQLVRRVILRNNCHQIAPKASNSNTIITQNDQECTVAELTELYCKRLYTKYNSYSQVATITGLDWRTVKKIIGD